jgi:hypothetical protein
MTRNLTLLLSLLVILSGCHHRESKTVDMSRWQRLDYGVFTVQAPPDWRKFTESGIDSYVAGLTNGTDSLEFDYGWYSYQLSPREVDSIHLFASDSIDGYEAILAIPKRNVKASVELSMDLPEHNRLSFGGFVHDSRIAVAILQSLRFKGGDTTKNGRLTLDQFTASFPRTGKSLFQMDCSDCHSRTRLQGGPVLTSEFIGQLGNDSIYRFLTHRYPPPSDSNFQCPVFTDWSRTDIDKIVAYLRNSP